MRIRIMPMATCCVLALFLWPPEGEAASNKCRITSIDEEVLVLKCERSTQGFRSGDTVKVKTTRKTPALEGC